MLNTMKIKIKDREVELKYSIRSLINYETIMDKQFNPQTTLEVIVYFMCVLMASDKQLHITLDEMMDIVDEQPELLNDFSTWLTEELTKQTMLEEEQETTLDEEPKKA